MIPHQLDEFKHEGGFTEGLSKERIMAQIERSAEQGAPECPLCGKPMIKRTVKRGAKAGKQFWGCSDYPQCQGTREN